MEKVRQYSSIYDKSSRDYKDQSIKNWIEIARALNVDVDDAKQKYNNIRTLFGKYIKDLKGKLRFGREDCSIKEELENVYPC